MIVNTNIIIYVNVISISLIIRNVGCCCSMLGTVAVLKGTAHRPTHIPYIGKGRMGSALMGSLQVSCFLTEGLFGYSR